MFVTRPVTSVPNVALKPMPGFDPELCTTKKPAVSLEYVPRYPLPAKTMDTLPIPDPHTHAGSVGYIEG
ncbi:MAG: hypothetical protein ACK55Z_20955, partial [bacterium]